MEFVHRENFQIIALLDYIIFTLIVPQLRADNFLNALTRE